jgi:predicted Zn-dependent protease
VYREAGQTGVGTGTAAAEAVDRALTAANLAPPDPLAGPVEKMPIRTGGLGIDDRRHTTIAEEDRVEVLQLAEKSFERTSIQLKDLLYRQERTIRSWVSSRGVEAEEASTTYALSASALSTTGASGETSASNRIASRHFSDVASLPFGTELRRRVEPLLRRESAPPKALPLVLDPRVMADLARALAPAFTASAVEDGSIVARYLGKRLASEILHLTDDAGLSGGLHTRGFDERGVPPIAVTLLKEGVVTGLYHDPESARARGLRPTGHVSGGQLRPSNLVVRPGARTRNVILTEIGPHLVLDRLPPLDLRTGRWTGRVPIVVADRHDRKGAFFVDLDIGVAELCGAIVEVAGDQERSGEVDAPSGVLHGVPLS